ncbi:mitochondrial cardiolipin hydrolase-like [Contarinia nasturtii]|uniref:mitochondrial cardiolipin hydrolase-like n=1 Tax=Contarinia nasturtii TaxID=265458 RepID=UPI0012D43A73|nr:mitochondrial cardiolipin hydrolase-like [Contarinia nasturtii]
MRLEITGIMKFGLLASTLLVSTDLLIGWYLRQKNRSPRLNEVFFVMSNALSCCPHTAKEDAIKKCPNPHCKAKLSRKIIEHIDSAKHLICIAMYMFTMIHISDAVMNAKRRGVNIRIISDSSMIASSNSQINRFQKSGINVRIAGDGDLYMHNKFCLIDVLSGEKSKENTHPLNGVLINGSMNWTANGFDRNWENILFTSDEHLKSEYKQAFDYIWSRIE